MQISNFFKLKENTINFLSFDWIYKYHLIAFSVLIFSIIFIKVDYLNIPLYWDETIYFVPSLFNKGLSVFTPNHYFLYEWHGHPPLFQLEHYFISKFFNDLTFSAHLTGLINFIFFLISFYYVLLKNFTWKVALISVISFTLYPHVIAQSSMFHPNFLMIATGLLSIQYYLDKKWKLYLLTALVSILTRESAIAFSFILFIHALIQYKKFNFRLKDFIYILFPIFILILFFAYNKYIDGHLFAHPYFKNRIKDGYSFFNFLNHNYFTVWDSLKDATWSTWPYPSIAIVILSLIYVIKKKARSIKLKEFDILFVSISFCFLLFYTLYADTIVRDFLVITIVFSTYNIYIFSQVFKKTIWLILFTVPLFIDSYDYSIGVTGYDTSLRENRLKPKYLKELSQFIDKRYSSKVTIGTGWPLYNLLRDPLYGYSKNKYNTNFSLEDQQVIVNTNLNAGFDRNYLPNPKIWNKVYSRNLIFKYFPKHNIILQVFEKKTLSKELIND